jgi:collagenase-like PrtC family protease
VPPNTIWGGGREPQDPLRKVDMDTINNVFTKELPEIELRYVFTNTLITPEIIQDYKSNQLLKRYIRPQDSIIINHQLLIDYIKTYFPQIKLIYSTTLNIKDINKVNDITENNMYVMNYAYNNDDEYVSQLTNRDNIEVLCAEPCGPDCKMRTKHYESISRQYLGLSAYDIPCPFCSPNYYYDLEQELKQKSGVTNERVEELTQMGITHFKLSGRGLKVPPLLEIFLYYLVKPEYQNKVRNYLLTAWW